MQGASSGAARTTHGAPLLETLLPRHRKNLLAPRQPSSPVMRPPARSADLRWRSGSRGEDATPVARSGDVLIETAKDSSTSKVVTPGPLQVRELPKGHHRRNPSDECHGRMQPPLAPGGFLDMRTLAPRSEPLIDRCHIGLPWLNAGSREVMRLRTRRPKPANSRASCGRFCSEEERHLSIPQRNEACSKERDSGLPLPSPPFLATST